MCLTRFLELGPSVDSVLVLGPLAVERRGNSHVVNFQPAGAPGAQSTAARRRMSLTNSEDETLSGTMLVRLRRQAGAAAGARISGQRMYSRRLLPTPSLADASLAPSRR